MLSKVFWGFVCFSFVWIKFILRRVLVMKRKILFFLLFYYLIFNRFIIFYNIFSIKYEFFVIWVIRYYELNFYKEMKFMWWMIF